MANRFIQLLQNDPLLGKNTGIKNNEIKLNWPYDGNSAQGATSRMSPKNPALLLEFRNDILQDRAMRQHLVGAVRRAMRYIAAYEPDLYFRPVNQNRQLLDRQLIA